MISYIHDNCVLPALDKPIYALYYEEAETPQCPYYLDRDLICVPFDTIDEANRAYLNTQPEEKTNA
jgi:hypothetical protein